MVREDGHDAEVWLQESVALNHAGSRVLQQVTNTSSTQSNYTRLMVFKCTSRSPQLCYTETTSCRTGKGIDHGMERKDNFMLTCFVLCNEDELCLFSVSLEKCCIFKMHQSKSVRVAAAVSPHVSLLDEREDIVAFHKAFGNSDVVVASDLGDILNERRTIPCRMIYLTFEHRERVRYSQALTSQNS